MPVQRDLLRPEHPAFSRETSGGAPDRTELYRIQKALQGRALERSEPCRPPAASIIRFAREKRPLIIFDSLIGFHDGKDQDASETRRCLQHYRRLAAEGASPVLLHHAGKRGALEAVPGKLRHQSLSRLRLLTGTAGGPNSRPGISTPYTLQESPLAGPAPSAAVCFRRFSVLREVAETNREIMERIIRENPGLSQSQLVKQAEAQGMAKHRAEGLLAEGVRDEWLESDSGKRGRKTYRLRDVVLGNL